MRTIKSKKFEVFLAIKLHLSLSLRINRRKVDRQDECRHSTLRGQCRKARPVLSVSSKSRHIFCPSPLLSLLESICVTSRTWQNYWFASSEAELYKSWTEILGSVPHGLLAPGKSTRNGDITMPVVRSRQWGVLWYYAEIGAWVFSVKVWKWGLPQTTQVNSENHVAW